MKQHTPLSTLEKTLITKLEQATVVLKETDNKLQDQRKEIAQLKSKLIDSPNIPVGCKVSEATRIALSTAKASLSTAQKQLQQEVDSFIASQVQDIHDRTSKVLQKHKYQKALSSDYSTATLAINKKKEEVNSSNTTIDAGVNGQVKCLIDWNAKEIFTFENLLQSDFSYQGQDYSIIKSDLSQIQAGNTYTFRSNHHSQR